MMNLSILETAAKRVCALGYTPCNYALKVFPDGRDPEGVIMGQKLLTSGPLQGTLRYALWTIGWDGGLYWGHYEMGSGEAHALFMDKASTHCQAKSSKIGEPIPA